jgi:sigma-B regulation protein RsbU (phosphoserine phosphatase)
VGGDFYDVVPLEGGHLGLVMADVSGKGMAAALFMALTRSLLRAEARRSSSPSEVLYSVDRLILEMSRASAFVTVFYGVLDPAQGTLCYARAGHDYPALRRGTSGQCELLAAAGRFLGFVDGLYLDEATVDVERGDTLVLYTDGMTDARSPAGELFGQERLLTAICSAKAASARALCDALFQETGEFQAGADQFDDQSVLVVHLE